MECRGAGASEHTTEGYSLSQYAEDIIELLNKLEIAKFTFVGHSMGGGLGYILGSNYFKRLNGLILLAPIPSGGYKPNKKEYQIKKKFREDKDELGLLNQFLSRPFRREMETDEWFKKRARHICSVSVGHFDEIALSMEQFNIKPFLKDIKTPTLILSGAHDTLLNNNQKDFQLLPNATHKIYHNAGHDIAVQEPLAIATEIQKFIKHNYK